jgi:hypothetical protein
MTTSRVQKDNDSPHMQSQWHSTLHSYVLNCCNTQWSRSVPYITISTLVPYATYLSLIIFKIVPHPMTLLIALPLQVIILYLILYCLFPLGYYRITYPLSSSHICKGTSIRCLTPPILSHSPPVHMYFPLLTSVLSSRTIPIADDF